MVRRQVEDIQDRVLAALKEKGAGGAKAADIRVLLLIARKLRRGDLYEER